MKNNWIITLILVCIISQVNGQTIELNKKISKSFKIKPETNVQILNKYGNIHIVPEATDSVRIEVEIKVVEKKPEKAVAKLDNIKIEFNDSPFYIIAKTVFADYKGSAMAEISDRATTSISGGNKVEINWTVYLPAEMELKVENKFGNVYTTNHTGNVTFDISYGDLQANELTGSSKLLVEFGNIYLKKLVNAKFDITNVQVELKSAQKLDVISRSSSWNVPFIKEINLDSKHDKFYADSIETLKGEVYFSNVKIGLVQKDILLKIKYGNLNIENIANNLRYLNLNASSADVLLMLPEGSSQKFSLNYRKTTLSLPDFINSFPKELVNPETQEFSTSGIIGTEKPEMTELKLSVLGGTLTIGKK